MKVLPWFALLFACTAVPADAHLTFAGTPKIDLFSSARLIDTNQSQSLEAVSTADGNLRLPSYKLAGVYFITGNNGQTFDNEAKDNDFTDPTGDNCKRLGFAVTSCASGLFNRACPYNDRIYDKCCEASYTYEASNCPAPRKLSSETCGGKHRCYCDTAQYPFASCSDPQIKGNACTDDGGTRYATCVCPNPVSTPYGCETYYAAPCGSVCKKAYADNCRNRTAVQTPYGCEKYFADCSSKCEKAYSDNCRNRNAVSAPYGCQQVYGDCQSKCEVAYPDNCHNRTAAIASCPANATCSYFADCAAKIQSWSCNSGYEKSGNSCIAAVKIGSYIYSDGSIGNEIIANKTIIAIIVDTSSRLAMSLEIETPKDGTEADTFCKNFTTQGTSSGSWSCPTMNDLQLIYNNKSILNNSLHNAGRPRLNGEDNIHPVYGNNWRYWSSEMTNYGNRRAMLLGKGNITSFNNSWPGYTIPVRKY